MGSEEYCGLGLAEASALIAAGEVSSVALTRAALARIERLEPELHAFVRVTPERALDDARRADSEAPRGPLHGIPIALKDLVDTRGIATEAGTKVLAGRVPDADAAVAARLAAAGTVLLGKLAMTEGAFSEHRPERPEPRNPWSPKHWTGVSSSGSGVAVAAGLAYGALGSDTGGSIRFPSSACGVTGLKPSRGRVSSQGIFPLAPSLDHVGVLARSAADCALLFDAIAEPAPPIGPARSIGLDRAVLAGIHPEVAAAAEQALDTFAALGFEVREVALPPLEPFARGWAVTVGVEAAAVHAEYYDRAPDDYGPAMRMLIELGQAPPAGAYEALEEARRDLASAMARLHAQVDLVLLPALPVPTPTLATLAQGGNDPDVVAAMLRFTAAFNYSGQPSLTLPAGFDADGLPIGLQLIGPILGEERLLAAGRAFQQATDWHRQRPPP
ncbi:MAG TPA: amidase [Allosphingosinicella sp.]|nr:amidase [Allosphingosinicella sp.]